MVYAKASINEMCFVKTVVVFLEVCCLFGYKLLFNVLCEKNAEPHGLFFFFSWRKIHFDIVSAFSRLENYEQEGCMGRYITLDEIESV